MRNGYHALITHPNGDLHRAFAANRCSRLAMSTPYFHLTYSGTFAHILAMT